MLFTGHLPEFSTSGQLTVESLLDLAISKSLLYLPRLVSESVPEEMKTSFSILSKTGQEGNRDNYHGNKITHKRKKRNIAPKRWLESWTLIIFF